MASLFWTGKTSFSSKLLINSGALISWIMGNALDASVIKERVKDGYDGKVSDHISGYDSLGREHYEKIARLLLSSVDCNGKKMADIGCGTGILSFLALGKGASVISAVDPSNYMLDKCKSKSESMKLEAEVMNFHEAEASKLPFSDGSFDIVLSSMVLGMVPDQQAALKEFARILKPGGYLAISTHGPAHYMEAIGAGLNCMKLKYFFNHRFEFWPRSEDSIRKYFSTCGLQQIETKQVSWTDCYDHGSEVFDFFAATSGLWFFHRLPTALRDEEAARMRSFYQRKGIKTMTSDVVFAYGRKKGEVLI